MKLTTEIILNAAKRATEFIGKDANWILLNQVDYANFMSSIGEPEWKLCHDLGGVAVAPSESVDEGDFGAMNIPPLPDLKLSLYDTKSRV